MSTLLNRRSLLVGTAAAAIAPSWALAAKRKKPTTQPGSSIDAIAAIKALRINAGPYAGSYEIAPDGRIMWYFSHLALLPIVQWLNPADLETYVRSYLDCYMSHVSAIRDIKDVNFTKGAKQDPNSFTLEQQDSDDSYAAMFLSLTARYLKASKNYTWFDSKKALVKDIANRNIVNTMKSNGMTSVFQPPLNQLDSTGYTMDNCEAYRGLRDFAELLRSRNDADAPKYDKVADGIAKGLRSICYKPKGMAFMPSDGDSRLDSSFYAGTTCNVFPQAFGVTEVADLFDNGYNYLNAKTPAWETGKYDEYPWMVLGFVAAQRKDTTRAKTQMAWCEELFANNRSLVTINELGWYQRAKNVLAGGVDI